MGSFNVKISEVKISEEILLEIGEERIYGM
jgi:hypothetical protein